MARPKATQAGPASPVGARWPAQERSKARFHALLDATRDLLLEREFSDIGVYEIAKRAEVAPTSAYHFIPSPEAAYVALAERYLVEQDAYVGSPIDRSVIQNWPDLISIRFDRSVEFYNRNPAFSRLFLSGTITSEVRRIDVESIDAISNLSYAWLDHYFVMPYLPNNQLKFTCLIGLHDGIWMTSYAKHGLITNEFAQEARAGAIAYCRTFLPEILPLRPPPARPEPAPHVA